MADNKNQMSLGDLCLSLADEFAVALVTVKRSHPNVRVNAVTLNIGQTRQALETPADTQDAGPLILSDRYPGSEAGWQLQLELGEKQAATVAGVKRPLAGRTDATALDLVAWEPLSVIDGISTGWSRLLAGFNINQVIDLARIEAPLLQEIIAETNSLHIRKLRQKVLLLKIPVPPLPFSDFGEKPLYDLLRLPVADVQQSFSRTVTQNEITALFELLDILNIVIDSDVLRKISLHQLLGT
jgi:hypothetical protein